MCDGEEVKRLKLALAGMLAERNHWARQLADAHDERDAARASAENLRVAAAWRENIILAVGGLCEGIEYKISGKPETWDQYHEGKADLAGEVLGLLDR